MKLRLVIPILLAAFLAATAYLFVWPAQDRATSSDAVIVLSGGRRERLAKGLSLMRRRLAPTLVISDGRAPGWTQANQLCAGHASFRVVCIYPQPYSTRGEARVIARLARERRWRSVIVVTSIYHVRRARMVVRRCFHGRVEAVGAQPSFKHYVEGTLLEWPKLLYQLTVSRSC